MLQTVVAVAELRSQGSGGEHRRREGKCRARKVGRGSLTARGARDTLSLDTRWVGHIVRIQRENAKRCQQLAPKSAQFEDRNSMRLFTNLKFSQKLHVGPAIVPTNTIDTVVNLANRLVLRPPQHQRLRPGVCQEIQPG
ncbi:hypothetical protein RSSM_04219 [Rhodopirellula sallentina SM41]|uniref:Uncharacterized protein n=1 Tax=Rhodopirellula sallentina SM41 TaxID=1263870 RepID=M5TYR7_9BACT|nr:hypothetical protein RSSM_04219 [Rhodopirellula sallentina SM41]